MAGHPTQINSVKDKLNEILTFLKPYLPLANAHATEFITEQQWERLIPEHIGDDLMACTDEELKRLPLLGFVDNEVQRENPSVVSAAEEMFHNCSLKENPCTPDSKAEEVVVNKCNKETTQTATVNERNSHNEHQRWIHSSLSDFCSCAKRNTIDGQGLAVSVSEMVEKLALADSDPEVFAPTYMNLKKSHEIDVLSDVCARLSRSTQCSLVVDIGSGKGYLGQTLYFQHKLTVLGVDAALSNTSGAEKRLGIVGKQWEGLNRNIKNQENGVKLTKKEKKQLRLKKKQESENVVRMCNNIEKVNDKVEATAVDSDFQTAKLMIESESEILDRDKAILVQCFKNGCYIPLTVYVDTDTDLKSIANEVLFSLSDNSNTCTTHICNPQKVHAVIDQNVQSKDVESTFEAKDCNDRVTDRYSASNQKCSSGTVIKQCDNIKTTTNTLTSIERDMNIMLTGLHTCGDLASTMLKLFVFNSDVKCLCSVGCCYHLLTEEFVQEKDSSADQHQYGFPLSSYLRQKSVYLGNTARNLACQSLHRMVTADDLQGYRFFPRALLQKMIVDLADPDSVQWIGLRGMEQKSEGTLDYIMKAWKKLKLPEDLVTEELVRTYLDKYEEQQQQLAALFQLKSVLAPCIESLILLDRICWLMEQETMKDVYLVKMFDPVISPRCYGIVATKN